jgi:alanine racemase
MSSAPESIDLHRPTWAEVNLDALRRNISRVKKLLPDSSRLIAVLKANGYGHGSVALGRVCAEEQVEMLAVAMLEEAIELRAAGVSLPILILGPLDRAQLEVASEEHLSVGLVGPEELHLADVITRSNGIPLRIHLKLDSGMNRMGLKDSDLEFAATTLLGNDLLRLEAIYTHFANSSDPADPFTEKQIEKFDAMLDRLRALGVSAPLHHAANSAATIRNLVRPGEFARVGLTLFGGEALDSGESRLEPLLTWRTRVARIKTIQPGEVVGYGATFTAARETVLATLPVGYADGYNRLLSNRGSVLVRGQRAPVVGRVSMDLITVDVTGIAGVAVGDPVVLLGRQGDEEISAEEIAGLTGTISYEVLCRISGRVARLYRDGEEWRVSSSLAQVLGEQV